MPVLKYDLFDEEYGKKSKKKKKKSYRYDIDGDFDEKKFDKYYGDDSCISYPPVIAPESLPVTFEKSLVNNQIEIREGNSVPEWMILDPLKDGGFHFGRKNLLGGNHYIGKPQDRDGSILIIGGPGSDKTSGLVIPTFATWRGHIVVIDVKPKADLLAQCERMSNSLGKPTLVFNPYKKDSCRYDPYSFISADGDENMARNCMELALNLIATVPGGNDRVWVASAQHLLAGVIANDIYYSSPFNETMAALQLKSVKELMKEIVGSKSEIAKMFVGKLKGLPEETLVGIGMDLTSLAILAADPLIEAILSPDEDSITIDWNWLNTAKEPFNIVLQLPNENLDVWKPMTTMLINQLIRTLQRRPDKYRPEGKQLPPVLIILDEFDRLGKVSSILSGLATLRNSGVTFSLVVQSLSQLEMTYGQAEMGVIIDTCAYIAILKVADYKSQKYFSGMIGNLVVPNRSVSGNYKSGTDEMNNYSLSISESREPIIFPHEFITLKDVILITPDGYCRVDKVPYYERLTSEVTR